MSDDRDTVRGGASAAPGYGRRLLICDPVCVLPYGHAISALNHFRNYLSDRFEDIVCIASKGLASEIAVRESFEREFTFLYNKYIPIWGRGRADSEIVRHPAYNMAAHDPFELVANADAGVILDKHEMSDADVIFLPGADFYGVVGFVNACMKRPPAQRPRIFVRMIGVLEAATPYYEDPLRRLADVVHEARSNELKIYVSAETPRYADHLSRLTQETTLVTPYPETSPPSPLVAKESFSLLCAGSARLDKGFHFLHDVMKSLVSQPGAMPIKLITQTLPLKGNEYWDKYTSHLYAVPGVELLEPTISSEQMRALYDDCDIVLLPYATDVYRMRGSAVMMEAASVGRLCLTLRGTAFAQQVEYYGLGDVVDTLSEIPDAIRRLSATPRQALEARMRQARTRFFLDVNAAYQYWFSR